MRGMLRAVAVGLAGLVSLAVLVGAALWFYPPPDAANASVRPVDRVDAAAVSDADRFRRLAQDDPRAALAQCLPAQPTYVSGLAGHLRDRSDEFAAARYAVEGVGGLTYLSADVLGPGGRTEAIAPVWVYGGAGYAALSAGADRLSAEMPGAGTLYGAGEQDPAAVRVVACVDAARRLTSGSSR